jgi:hypothetical protein
MKTRHILLPLSLSPLYKMLIEKQAIQQEENP